MVPLPLTKTASGQAGEVEQPVGHCVVPVGAHRERDAALWTNARALAVGSLPSTPIRATPASRLCVACWWRYVCGHHRDLGLARPAPAGEEEQDRRVAVAARRRSGPRPSEPPPSRGSENGGTWSPTSRRPAFRAGADAGEQADGQAGGQDDADHQEHRARPARTATGRGASGGGAPGGAAAVVRRRRSTGPRSTGRCSRVADEHVDGHGHEQDGQVGDRVAEQPHGVAAGRPVVPEPAARAARPSAGTRRRAPRRPRCRARPCGRRRRRGARPPPAGPCRAGSRGSSGAARPPPAASARGRPRSRRGSGRPAPRSAAGSR